MGSDWWMFNEDVERWTLRLLKEFGKEPTKAYISENWYYARGVVAKMYPHCIIIKTDGYEKDGKSLDFYLE